MLIKDYDLLEIIMKAFLEECQAKKNSESTPSLQDKNMVT